MVYISWIVNMFITCYIYIIIYIYVCLSVLICFDGIKNKKKSGSVSSVQNLDLLDRLNLIPKIAMGGLLRSQLGVILEVHEHVIQNFKDQTLKVAPKVLKSAVLPCLTMVDKAFLSQDLGQSILHRAQVIHSCALCVSLRRVVSWRFF